MAPRDPELRPYRVAVYAIFAIALAWFTLPMFVSVYQYLF